MGVKSDIKKALAEWFRESANNFKRRMFKYTRAAKTVRTRPSKLGVYGDDVINYINYGVKGHGRGTFKSKARVKNVNPKTPYQFKKFGPPKSVVEQYNTKKNKGGEFLISRAIGRFGLEGKNFIDKEKKKAFTGKQAEKNLQEKIVNAINNRK